MADIQSVRAGIKLADALAGTIIDGYAVDGRPVRTGFGGWRLIMTPRRTVVVATAHPQRTELLDALLAHAIGYDIINVEPLTHAYSRIRQAVPDLVIIHSA